MTAPNLRSAASARSCAKALGHQHWRMAHLTQLSMPTSRACFITAAMSWQSIPGTGLKNSDPYLDAALDQLQQTKLLVHAFAERDGRECREIITANSAPALSPATHAHEWSGLLHDFKEERMTSTKWSASSGRA